MKKLLVLATMLATCSQSFAGGGSSDLSAYAYCEANYQILAGLFNAFIVEQVDSSDNIVMAREATRAIKGKYIQFDSLMQNPSRFYLKMTVPSQTIAVSHMGSVVKGYAGTLVVDGQPIQCSVVDDN